MKTKTKLKAKPVNKKASAPVKKLKVKVVNNRNINKPVKKKTAPKVTKAAVVPAPVKKAAVTLPKVKKFKPNRKTRYTAKELQFFKNIILQERNKIIESARANMDALVDQSGEYVGDDLTYASHMAEQGSDEMEREKNYMFVQRDEKYLGYLQEALVRIDLGTYGVCIDCIDGPKNLCRTCPLIDKERLELVPITQHCIECKNLRG